MTTPIPRTIEAGLAAARPGTRIRRKAARANRVHAAWWVNPDGDYIAACGRTMPVMGGWWPTDEPVTCERCRAEGDPGPGFGGPTGMPYRV